MSWRRIVGPDVRRRAKQNLPMTRAMLRDVVRRVPDDVTPGVPYLLTDAQRADMNALVPPEGMTAARARSFLRVVRTGAHATHDNATFVFDLNGTSSDEDEEPAPRPPRAGKRGGRSRRASNRKR